MVKELEYPMRLDSIKNAIWRRNQLCDLVTLSEAAGITKRHLQFILNGDKPLTPEIDKRLRKYLNQLNKLEIAV